MPDDLTERMRSLSLELQKLVEAGASLDSEQVLEKSRKFDELVITYYREKKRETETARKKLRSIRGKYKGKSTLPRSYGPRR